MYLNFPTVVQWFNGSKPFFLLMPRLCQGTVPVMSGDSPLAAKKISIIRCQGTVPEVNPESWTQLDGSK